MFKIIGKIAARMTKKDSSANRKESRSGNYSRKKSERNAGQREADFPLLRTKKNHRGANGKKGRNEGGDASEQLDRSSTGEGVSDFRNKKRGGLKSSTENRKRSGGNYTKKITEELSKKGESKGRNSNSKKSRGNASRLTKKRAANYDKGLEKSTFDRDDVSRSYKRDNDDEAGTENQESEERNSLRRKSSLGRKNAGTRGGSSKNKTRNFRSNVGGENSDKRTYGGKRRSQTKSASKKGSYSPTHKGSGKSSVEQTLPELSNIVRQAKKVEIPGKTFVELNLEGEDFLQAIEAAGFKNSMPVQEKVIPLALEGKNLAVSSPTGSGKTLAFVLPILQRHFKSKHGMTLVLSPTREIAIQTKNVFDKVLGNSTEAGLVIGGTDMKQQAAILRNYPPFIIATPGRLVDMMKRGLVWLSYVEIFVLDEMDRMFDMGFEDDIETIFKEVAKTSGDAQKKSKKIEPKKIENKNKLQVMMFTATFTPSIEKVVKRYVPTYETLIIERKMKINENINHCMVKVKNSNRVHLLKKIFDAYAGEKLIVFFNTIRDTLAYSKMLKSAGINGAVSLHSKKSQNERMRALSEFSSGKKRILLATDVAARGIDVPMVGVVVNFEIPRNNEEYIHRIGRTGRANSLGMAITFVSPDNNKDLKKLEKTVKVNFHVQTENELMESAVSFLAS